MKIIFIILTFLSVELLCNNADSVSANVSIDSIFLYKNYEMLDLDSVYNLDDLNEQELFEDELTFNYSKGWFPKIIGKYSNFMINISGISIIDYGKNIESDNFFPTRNPFSTRDKRNSDESEQREKYSDDEKSVDDFGSWAYGLKYSFSSFLPFFIEIGLSYQSLKSDLYAIDKSKQFLYGNEIKEFKEGSSVLVKDYGISGQVNFIIPIYGAFVGFEDFFSIYYLNLGYQGFYVFDSNVIQEFQILNNKDKIRYSNGLDNLRVIDNRELENTLKFRTFLELGIGMRMGSSGGFVDYGITFGIPMQSLITDDNWKQYFLELEMKIAF